MSDQEIDSIDNPENSVGVIKDDRIYPYIDHEEAVFLLGVLKNFDCSSCPCLAKGCRGGYTRQELAVITYQDFLTIQPKGTEGYLCMKLRNVINMTTTEKRELFKDFDQYFKKKVGIIAGQKDTTVITDSDHEGRIAELERGFNLKLQSVNANAQNQMNGLIHKCDTIEKQAKAMEQQLAAFQRQNQDLAAANKNLSQHNETLVAEINRLRG